ncbi:hypothetical protein DTO027B5_7745 [Paecilomyces variotii]|nr:hypothetical protein DTO169C6_8688 [Paecilomyces variotii]KAJ9261587.1 hypothetical protein DTO195F2_4117 [Paecilomyces variotii]KAJ9321131.1 hypothetical protein DTO027B3_7887 [Paecilomyces variotii]KAJ9330439.1 hypothetical protein DTO027B5_7745 [Paecilomyces variotii]KAJ9358605.1 hypothetical protein DTO027B9_2278 [Paecilomyces variotii]
MKDEILILVILVSGMGRLNFIDSLTGDPAAHEPHGGYLPLVYTMVDPPRCSTTGLNHPKSWSHSSLRGRRKYVNCTEMTAVTSNRASLKQIPIDEDGIPINVSCADLQMIQDKETGFCLIQKPSFPTADLGLAHGTGHYCIGHILSWQVSGLSFALVFKLRSYICLWLAWLPG